LRILIPIIMYLVAHAVAVGYVPGWYPILLVGLILPGLIQTVKAGNRLTPQFQVIHRFSVALTKLVWRER
jgi:hypothetical protein